MFNSFLSNDNKINNKEEDFYAKLSNIINNN